MSEPTALVALRGASYAYEDGPVVLSGLDFDVREGARWRCSVATAAARPR